MVCFRFLFFLTIFVAFVKANSRPNILLIVSEDNGPELGCYGEPYVQTPVLDRFASNGVRFDRAYVPQAGCSQSRAALLTGLYPHQNGQIGLATWKFRLYNENTPNLIHSLKRSGYRTGLIGKLHVNPASAFPFDYKKIPSSNFSRKKLGDYARFAKSFMADGDKPFFLSVNYPDPHRPFIRQIKGIPKNPLSADDVKPLAYFGIDTPELRNQTADYYNCMSRLDTLIGDLLEALSQSGKQKNTLIIYMGDHGADLLRGKRTSYEGGVRVPLIIQWSGREGFGKSVRNELVSTLDLMPTILSAANAALPKGLAGKSLIPMLQGQVKGWREYLFTEFNLHSAHNFYPQRTIRGERFKLIQNLQSGLLNPGYDFTINRFFDGLQKTITESNNVRDAYSLMRRPPAFELYDLNNDPFEFRNLADDKKFRSQLQSLKNKLAEWRRETNDPFLNPKNILQLQSEIKASIRDGKPDKKLLKLNYWNYFFE